MTTNEEIKPLKLDLGCGQNKINADFIGVDCLPLPGVDVVLDLCKRTSKAIVKNKKDPKSHIVEYEFEPWPWADNSVDEAHCSHFVEHLQPEERIHFVNELYRVLKPGSKVTIIVPHWASCRAYGDLTHAWPPVSEFWFFYLSSEWRKVNSPHTDFETTKNPKHYKCNFACTWGFSLHPALGARNQEYQNFALNNFKEAAQDTIATCVKVV